MSDIELDRTITDYAPAVVMGALLRYCGKADPLIAAQESATAVSSDSPIIRGLDDQVFIPDALGLHRQPIFNLATVPGAHYKIEHPVFSAHTEAEPRPRYWYFADLDVCAWTKRAQRVDRLQRYLDSVSQAGLISPETASEAWNVWLRLKSLTAGNLPVPDAAAGPNGDLLYTWDRQQHHLELEIVMNSPPSFFYLNQQNGEVWEADYNADALPQSVVRVLRHLSRSAK